MDTKSIIVILVLIIIILTCGIIGLVIQSQGAQNANPAVNNTTLNNTSVNTTVEQINSDPVQQSESQSSDSDSQSSDSGMPEDVRKRYAARQKAAEDGIPMYEYAHSPELVEKYQSMV